MDSEIFVWCWKEFIIETGFHLLPRDRDLFSSTLFILWLLFSQMK
jgi:hypothetical protein